jgi:heme exporter protein B
VKAFLRPLLAILWKDTLLEIRTKDMTTTLIIFSLLVVIIFNIAIDPSPASAALVAPGAIWAAYAFAGILGLNRSFILEKDRGSLEGLLLLPVARETLFIGKMVGNLLFMLLAEAIMYPVFAVLFNLPIFHLGFAAVALLATVGFATVGTLFSAMAVNTRAREVMLPILFFPVVIPIILGAVTSSRIVLIGGALSEVSVWLQIMLVFDVLFLVMSTFAFEYVVED